MCEVEANILFVSVSEFKSINPRIILAASNMLDLQWAIIPVHDLMYA